MNDEKKKPSEFHEWFFGAMGISPEGRAALIEMSALCREQRKALPLHPREHTGAPEVACAVADVPADSGESAHGVSIVATL